MADWKGGLGQAEAQSGIGLPVGNRDRGGEKKVDGTMLGDALGEETRLVEGQAETPETAQGEVNFQVQVEDGKSLEFR